MVSSGWEQGSPNTAASSPNARGIGSKAQLSPVGTEEDQAGKNDEKTQKDDATSTAAQRAAATKTKIIFEKIEQPGQNRQLDKAGQATVTIIHETSRGEKRGNTSGNAWENF
jgi:hypothetical protein